MNSSTVGTLSTGPSATDRQPVRPQRSRARISQTALQERAGRISKRAFDRLIETGLLNPAGEDGRWPESELDRIDTVMALGRDKARDLSRRVILLPWEGPEYTLGLLHRRRAVEELLSSDLRPAARKMREVRRELDILHRRTTVALGWVSARKPRSYGLSIPHDRWSDIVAAANDEILQREYQVASYYAQILPDVMRAERLAPEVDVPAEERLAFVLVNLLLRYPGPRTAAGLDPLRERRGPDIDEAIST